MRHEITQRRAKHNLLIVHYFRQPNFPAFFRNYFLVNLAILHEKCSAIKRLPFLRIKDLLFNLMATLYADRMRCVTAMGIVNVINIVQRFVFDWSKLGLMIFRPYMAPCMNSEIALHELNYNAAQLIDQLIILLKKLHIETKTDESTKVVCDNGLQKYTWNPAHGERSYYEELDRLFPRKSLLRGTKSQTRLNSV